MIEYKLISKSEMAWQGIVFWAIVFSVIETPLGLFEGGAVLKWELWGDSVVASIFAVDFFRICKFVVTDSRRKSAIIKNPKDTLFLIATFATIFIGMLPINFIISSFGLSKWWKLIKLFRVLRIIRLMKVFSLIGGKITMLPGIVKSQIIFAGSISFIHWVACLWMSMNPAPNIDFYTNYNKALYWTITTLTTIGYGDITPNSNSTRVFTMFIMILGVATYGIVIGNISRMFSARDRHKEKTMEKVADLKMFFDHYEVPQNLRRQTFTFVNHLYSKRLGDHDDKIIADLPHALQDELLVYIKMQMIKNIEVFFKCSSRCLKEVAKKLVQKHYSPGQQVVSFGEMGHEMFIIGHGTVDVALDDGSVLATLTEGHVLGEASLIEERERSANAITKSYCDIYSLSKEDFLELTEQFPILLQNLNKVLNERKRANEKNKKAA